jgi:hypothetical protein
MGLHGPPSAKMLHGLDAADVHSTLSRLSMISMSGSGRKFSRKFFFVPCSANGMRNDAANSLEREIFSTSHPIFKIEILHFISFKFSCPNIENDHIIYVTKKLSTDANYDWINNVNAIIKVIVSRDWGRLQMGSLDRSEFRTILLKVYFLFNIHFKLELFQNGVRSGAL